MLKYAYLCHTPALKAPYSYLANYKPPFDTTYIIYSTGITMLIYNIANVNSHLPLIIDINKDEFHRCPIYFEIHVNIAMTEPNCKAHRHEFAAYKRVN